jgi:hypothetical protein
MTELVYFSFGILTAVFITMLVSIVILFQRSRGFKRTDEYFNERFRDIEDTITSVRYNIQEQTDGIMSELDERVNNVTFILNEHMVKSSHAE